jgi:HEAT repeats
MNGDETLPSGAAARAARTAGGPTVCPRCGELGAARWCETCGLDLTPDEPRPPNSGSYAATQREHRWRIEHPDVAAAEREAARKPEPSKAAGQPEDGGGHSQAKQAATYAQIRAAGQKWSLGPLVAALGNRDGRIREDAVVALGRAGDEFATGPLLGALRDGDPYVRAAAAEALPRVARPEAAVPCLIAALGDDDYLVRGRAAEALGNLGAHDAIEPLFALLRREEPGSRAQRAVAAALERLGAGEARAERRSRLTSPLVLWIVGLALFGLGVALASASGIGFGSAAAGLVGFLLLLGARLQAARGAGQGSFHPGGDLGGADAIWLGASVGDGGGWADFGDGGGGGGGGDGGSF